MIAISENLSKSYTVEVYPDDKSKEALMEAYIDALSVIGKYELQRKKAWELNQQLLELFK